jgi:hypothetical protein
MDFNLSQQFTLNGLEVFDTILRENYASLLADEIASAMDIDSILVNHDGISMRTINGNDLITAAPDVKILYDNIFYCLKKSIPDLLMLDDLEVAISANLLRRNLGNAFRYHFDRHEYTVILYLTQNKVLPLSIYPRIRSDPRLTESIWHYSKDSMIPESIDPYPGRLLCFEGRTCLHGIVPLDGMTDSDDESGGRISLQFAFDTRFQNFEGQHYYGRKNSS